MIDDTAPNSTQLRVVTVTSKGYLSGTFVTLASFFRHHPDLAVEIVVLHDGLAPEEQALIRQLGANIRFEQVSKALLAQAGAVVIARPDLAQRKARFFSLELFRLSPMRTLFLDSDLLVQGTLTGLLEMQGQLVACPDPVSFTDQRRKQSTLATVASGTPGTLEDTFNAGVMVFDESEINPDRYAQALELMSAETFLQLEVTMTDQAILNLMYAGCTRIAPVRYNFLLHIADKLTAQTDASVVSASVLHFCAPGKPWEVDQMLRRPQSGFALKAYQNWHDAMATALTEVSLYSVAKALRKE